MASHEAVRVRNSLLSARKIQSTQMTHTRTCVGRFCDANYMNTVGVNLIRGTKYAESRFLYAAISRLFFHVEAVILGLENLLLSMLNSTHDNVINPTTGYR